MIIFSAIISLIAAFITLFMGMLVYAKSPQSRLNRLFMLLCLAFSYWSLSDALTAQAADRQRANIWLELGDLWPLAIALLLHFVLEFTGQKRALARKLTYLAIYGPMLAIALTELLGDAITLDPISSDLGWIYEPAESLWGDLGFLLPMLYAGLAAFLCLRYYLHLERGREKKAARLAAIGLGLPIVYGTITDGFLPLFGIRLPLFTSAFALALGIAVFIGYGMWKYGLFTLTPASAAQKILDTMSDGLVLLNADHEVLAVNPATTRLLQCRKKELLNQPLTVFFSDKDDSSYLCKRLVDESRDFIAEMETTMKTKSGNDIPVSLSSSSIRDEDGVLQGCICIIRDIRQRKRVEKKLARQQLELIMRNEELTALYEISQTTSHITKQDDLLAEAIKAMTHLGLFKLQHEGGIFVVEDNRMKLVFSIHQGSRASKDVKTFFDFTEDLRNMVERLSVIDDAVVVDDAVQEAIAAPLITPLGHIIVPLTAPNRMVGVLYLYASASLRLDARKTKLLTSIGSRIGTAIENVQLFEQATTLSLYDPLTGLANRRLMYLELERGIARAQRGRSLSIIMMDLDYFKRFNDTYGHCAGDDLLKLLADGVIKREVRQMDLPARYGGEEFLIILPDTELEAAARAAERIRRRVEALEIEEPEGGGTTRITISLGVAQYNPALPNVDAFIEHADLALYQAKSQGRNRVVSYFADQGGALRQASA